jgi:SAM-dependent methyltransferase
MEKVKNTLLSIRAWLNRALFPTKWYWLPIKSTKPISAKFGFDRGTPIDRYWIEDFLGKNKEYIKGNCLEVTDKTYTLKYGGKQVTKADVLDIDENNTRANIIGDLRNLSGVIKGNTYDCIILTHVLGLIDDLDSAISECHRILKPKGVLLATSACFSPTYDLKSNFWRFTLAGAGYVFGKFFNKDNLEVTSYGNVFTGQCFWVGMSQEDITEKQLQYNDPRFPCIVAVRAVKGMDTALS